MRRRLQWQAGGTIGRVIHNRQGRGVEQPIIVFDLDGTLVDTAADLVDSLNFCLESAGMRTVPTTGVKQFVGFGAKVMIQRAFAAEGRPLGEDRLEELFAMFLAHYAAHMPGHSQPYPGAVAALQRFQHSGWLMAVCTNKFEASAKQLISALGLTPWFGAVCGQDSFPFRKPDPRHLTETIAAAGGNATHAIMVGDSVTDIDTAKAAGVPVVAVDFGYSDRPVRDLGPSRVISRFDELTVDMAAALVEAAAGRDGSRRQLRSTS